MGDAARTGAGEAGRARRRDDVAVARMPWRSRCWPSVVIVVVVIATGVVGGSVAQKVVWDWEEVPKIAMVPTPATTGEDGAKPEMQADNVSSEIVTNVSNC